MKFQAGDLVIWTGGSTVHKAHRAVDARHQPNGSLKFVYGLAVEVYPELRSLKVAWFNGHTRTVPVHWVEKIS
jgi:hypothetical protein